MTGSTPMMVTVYLPAGAEGVVVTVIVEAKPDTTVAGLKLMVTPALQLAPAI